MGVPGRRTAEAWGDPPLRAADIPLASPAPKAAPAVAAPEPLRAEASARAVAAAPLVPKAPVARAGEERSGMSFGEQAAVRPPLAVDLAEAPHVTPSPSEQRAVAAQRRPAVRVQSSGGMITGLSVMPPPSLGERRPVPSPQPVVASVSQGVQRVAAKTVASRRKAVPESGSPASRPSPLRTVVGTVVAVWSIVLVTILGVAGVGPGVTAVVAVAIFLAIVAEGRRRRRARR